MYTNHEYLRPNNLKTKNGEAAVQRCSYEKVF